MAVFGIHERTDLRGQVGVFKDRIHAVTMRGGKMAQDKPRIRVYYDGACPQCVKDRQTYERLSKRLKNDIQWIDITGKERFLRSMGIDPEKALRELHVQDENREILSEIDAYTLLMKQIPVLKPLAMIIGLPWVRPVLSRLYHWSVTRRLRRTGRM